MVFLPTLALFVTMVFGAAVMPSPTCGSIKPTCKHSQDESSLHLSATYSSTSLLPTNSLANDKDTLQVARVWYSSPSLLTNSASPSRVVHGFYEQTQNQAPQIIKLLAEPGTATLKYFSIESTSGSTQVRTLTTIITVQPHPVPTSVPSELVGLTKTVDAIQLSGASIPTSTVIESVNNNSGEMVSAKTTTPILIALLTYAILSILLLGTWWANRVLVRRGRSSVLYSCYGFRWNQIRSRRQVPRGPSPRQWLRRRDTGGLSMHHNHSDDTNASQLSSYGSQTPINPQPVMSEANTPSPFAPTGPTRPRAATETSLGHSSISTVIRYGDVSRPPHRISMAGAYPKSRSASASPQNDHYNRHARFESTWTLPHIPEPQSDATLKTKQSLRRMATR